MQDTSLTISSTTSSSTTTFPSVSPWIYSLLTEIIHTLPPSASTFEQLFTRYQQVLAERGIDESEAEGEQDAYALLLKLSMQKGSTWAQKWASAQRALPPSASPSLDVLKARLDSLDATQPQHHHHQQQQQPQSQQTWRAPVASKSATTTGLPSNSSSNTRNSLAIPYIGARLSSNLDGPLTSTPQRPRSAGPSLSTPQKHQQQQRQRESELDLQVTPVKKTPRRVSFLSPRRPTASSVEYSSRASPFSEDDEDSDEQPLDLTPEPMVRPPHPRRTPTRPHSTPLPTHHRATPVQQQQLEPNPEVTLADRFRRASLLTGFFDRWRDRADTLHQRHQQTTELRHTVLLKRSLAVWALRLRYTTDVLEPKADAWAELNRARRSVNTWVFRMRKKRKHDWEERMKAGLEEFRARSEPRLLAEAWDCWRDKALEVRADRFRQRTLVSSTFRRWSASASKAQQLHHLAADLLRMKQAERLYLYLEQWHRATALRLAEREVAARHDELLLRTAWQTWYHRRQRVHAADMWSNVKVARNAFRAWASRLMTVDTLQLQAEELDKRREKEQLRHMFKSWSLKARGQLFEREVINTNTSRKALHTWLIRCHTVTVELEERADDFEHEASQNLVSGALVLWKNRLDHQRVLIHAADTTANSTLVSKTFSLWRQRWNDRGLDDRKADVAREFFLSRRAWVKWGLQVIEQRGMRLQNRREREAKQSVFAVWLKKTRQQQSENVLVASLQNAIDLRLVQDTLHIWVQRVVELRSREISVAQERDGKVTHLAFLKWRNRARKRMQDHSLIESFQDVKQEDLLRRCFWIWNSKMHNVVDIRNKAEEKGRSDRAMLLTAAFDKWRSKARKQKLDRLELAFGRAKDQVQLGESLLKWKHKSKMLPAMRFSEKLAIQHIFYLWREAVPRKHRLLSADGHYARKLLSEAVGKWRYLWKSRVNRRAADRFRPRQLQRRSLPSQPTAPAAAAAAPAQSSRPSLSESSSEPVNLLQARLKHRMRLSQMKGFGTESSTPTLVEDDDDDQSESDSTERTPLEQQQQQRPSLARRMSRPSAGKPSTSHDVHLSGLGARPRRSPPSVSDTGSSSAAGMALSELRARVKQRASLGAQGEPTRPASTPAVVVGRAAASTRAPHFLEAGRQRLAAFKSRRAGSSVDVGGDSSYGSSSFM